MKMKVINFLAVVLVTASVTARKVPILECRVDCDEDADCAEGLLCADVHEKDLTDAGHDPSKAYCGPVGLPHFEVCYDPKKLATAEKIPITSRPTKDGIKGLCEADCDLDSDCAKGLWCADQHTGELMAANLDIRTVNCKGDYPGGIDVCFDPAVLQKNGGSGGDPHFRTYDGTKYDYHGKCDLVMARSASFGSGLGMDVHIRTSIVAGWSLISNAALRIGDDVFELANDGSVYLNSMKDVEFPVSLAGRFEVSSIEEIVKSTHPFTGKISELPRRFITIQLHGKEKISMTLFKNMISIKIDALLNGTEGMLGIHGKEGMVGRDRLTVFDNANDMGSEWQVRDTEPMLFHDARAPQFPEECILPSVNTRRLRVTEEEKRVATEACADVDEDMFNFCIEDVLITGDYEVAHGYGMAF